MYVETVLTTNGNVAVGDSVSTASRDYQKGTCTIEVAAGVSNTENPVITVYGKLIQSDDDSVDSGWAALASWSTTGTNDVSGFPVDILPNMSASVTTNGTDQKNIKVTIGYNKYA